MACPYQPKSQLKSEAFMTPSSDFASPATGLPRLKQLPGEMQPFLLARVLRSVVSARNSSVWALVAVVLATGLCALFVDARALAPGGAACAVALMGVVWPWLSMRKLRGELRFFSARVREGDEVEVGLKLRNGAMWPVHGVSLCGWTAPGSEGEWGVACVPGRQTVEVRHRLRARRGVYPMPEIALASSFPFGLWEARCGLMCERQLLVWPRTFGVGALPPLRGAARHEGQSPSNRAGTGGEVLGARPFREGDSLRRVHWAQTARYDRLIVCEMQATQTPCVEVLLDLDSAVHAGTGAASSREWAIRIAASLCESWTREGACVALRYGQTAIPHGSGSSQVAALLDALARVPGEDAAPCPSLSEICEGLKTTPKRNTVDLRVVITTGHALQRFKSAFPASPKHCVIALDANAFDDATPGNTAPVGGAGLDAPLIQVTEPENVAAQVRRGLEEASRVL